MRFDWYQATVEAEPLAVINMLSKLGDKVVRADNAAKRWRYRQGFEVLSNSTGHAAYIFIDNNGDMRPHVLASSDQTDALVDVVRQEWPESHLVTRMDSAEDFIDSSAYDRLRKVTRKVAKQHGLKFPKYEDDLNPSAGRTQYIGGPTSDYRGRLYEKGREQANKCLAGLDLVSMGLHNVEVMTVWNQQLQKDVKTDEWTRLELQIRPKGEEARRAAAVATPEQAWTFSNWTSQLASEAMAIDLERFYIRTKKISKDDEALLWMCHQYGGLLTRFRDDLGDWKAVGMQVGELISKINSEKEKK